MNLTSWIQWIGFSLFVILALSIDTFLLNKKNIGPHRSLRAAFYWTCGWISLALIFNCLLWVYYYYNNNIIVADEKSLAFFTGYLIEKMLAFDNLFIFYIIFAQFKIPLEYQHRVFSYGIWSAIVLRLIFILCGIWLIKHFEWALYVMGIFLVLLGIKMLFSHKEDKDFLNSRFNKFLQNNLRVTPELHQERFFVRLNSLWYVTPLFVALVCIEMSDVFFAIDSIPAIFAITTDPFIIWSSNIFAILGLRALYFLLSSLATQFRLLQYAIALILFFVGAKMLLEPWIAIPSLISLQIIASILLIFILLSILGRDKSARQ